MRREEPIHIPNLCPTRRSAMSSHLHLQRCGNARVGQPYPRRSSLRFSSSIQLRQSGSMIETSLTSLPH
jgi:hypothetical protein